MEGSSEMKRELNLLPRVVVIGLASCFGCQLQITNAEAHLTDVLGQIDLKYWQLASSEPMPKDFDVAVIEGAVTTKEAIETCKLARERASAVVTVGACANLAGIPGMASAGFEGRAQEVYPDATPTACGTMIAPRSVPSVIDIDAAVRCCPIDSYDFIDMLQRVLYGSNRTEQTKTLCGECKLNERGCFYDRSTLCLGLVTHGGCGARCTGFGRPCNGCAGLSPDANIESAHAVCRAADIDPARLDVALGMFNQAGLADRVDA